MPSVYEKFNDLEIQTFYECLKILRGNINIEEEIDTQIIKIQLYTNEISEISLN